MNHGIPLRNGGEVRLWRGLFLLNHTPSAGRKMPADDSYLLRRTFQAGILVAGGNAVADEQQRPGNQGRPGSLWAGEHAEGARADHGDVVDPEMGLGIRDNQGFKVEVI